MAGFIDRVSKEMIMNSIKVFFILIAVICLVACKEYDPIDMEITDFGVYELGNDLMLYVKDEDGIVTYRLQDKNT